MVARELVSWASSAFAGKKLPKFEPLAKRQGAASAQKIEAGNAALREWFMRRAVPKREVR